MADTEQGDADAVTVGLLEQEEVLAHQRTGQNSTSCGKSFKDFYERKAPWIWSYKAAEVTCPVCQRIAQEAKARWAAEDVQRKLGDR